MNYEKLNLQDHVDIWDAAKVEHLENGIIAAQEAIKNYHENGSTEGGVQANWEQNDPAAADYIKNKPFCSEIRYGHIFSTEIYPSSQDSLTFNFKEVYPECTQAGSFVKKSTLYVTINGVKCKCRYNINTPDWRPAWDSSTPDYQFYVVLTNQYDGWYDETEWEITFWNESIKNIEVLSLSFDIEYNFLVKIPDIYMPNGYITEWDLRDYVSDWDVDDDYSKNYIKNRTHYKNTYNYNICNKQAITFTEDSNFISFESDNLGREYYNPKSVLSTATITFYDSDDNKIIKCVSSNGICGSFNRDWHCQCAGLTFDIQEREESFAIANISGSADWLPLNTEIYMTIEVNYTEITYLPDYYLSSNIAKIPELKWSDVGTTQFYKYIGWGCPEDSMYAYYNPNVGEVICFDVQLYNGDTITYTWTVDGTLTFDCPHLNVYMGTYETDTLRLIGRAKDDVYSFTCYKPELYATIDEKYIPDTVARAPKVTLENITEAPTAEQYNAILNVLRQAGILA